MKDPDRTHPQLLLAAQLCADNKIDQARDLLRSGSAGPGWPEGLAEDIEAIITISDLPKETWVMLEPNAQGDRRPMPAGRQAMLDIEEAVRKARSRGRRDPFVESLLDDIEKRLAQARVRVSSARAWALFSLLMSGSLLTCVGLEKGKSEWLAVAGVAFLALMVAYAAFARLPRYELYVRFLRGEVFGLGGVVGSLFDPRTAGDFLIECLPGVVIAPFVAIGDLFTARSRAGD